MNDAAHVLVVDDEVEVVRALLRVVRSGGHIAEAATDASTAIEAARRQTPDLIIIDAWLGAVSGFELTRQFRENSLTARTPIIMLSGMDNDDMRESAAAAGVTAFAGKPIDAVELRELVQSALDASQARA
jgi:CheY-like chemotaxis protein